MENKKDKFYDILSGTEQKADDKLKYRIMQQIQTESALSRKKVSEDAGTFWSTVVPLLAVMYAILGVLCVGFYFFKDALSIDGFSFGMSVFLVSITVGAYLLISVFDEQRRQKKLSHKK